MKALKTVTSCQIHFFVFAVSASLYQTSAYVRYFNGVAQLFDKIVEASNYVMSFLARRDMENASLG